MSQTNKRNIYINPGLLKINRISLLNQSDFKLSFKKMYIPQKQLNIFKELILNNKCTEKIFDIYFTPIQNLNSNIKLKGNIYKTNPLTEKNKIIKKHNILKKIDFNINPHKKNFNKKNRLELLLYNNNNNKICNSRSKLPINKLKDNKETINLPLLTNTNTYRKQKKNNNNIDLYKNVNRSSSYNEFSAINISSSSSNKLLNNNIFTNEQLKNTYNDNKQKLKRNISDKEIQTNISSIINNDIHEKAINHHKNELNVYESNDESSNNDDIKKIENIIAKSNYKKNYKYRNINHYKNDLHNFQSHENKSNYILLKSLYKTKNYDERNNYNIISQQCKTERTIFLKEDNNIGKISDIKNRSNYYLDKDIIFINRNNNNENKEINQIKYTSDKHTIPYNYKTKFIQKNINLPSLIK